MIISNFAILIEEAMALRFERDALLSSRCDSRKFACLSCLDGIKGSNPLFPSHNVMDLSLSVFVAKASLKALENCKVSSLAVSFGSLNENVVWSIAFVKELFASLVVKVAEPTEPFANSHCVGFRIHGGI
jgi:hypothetical protein